MNRLLRRLAGSLVNFGVFKFVEQSFAFALYPLYVFGIFLFNADSINLLYKRYPSLLIIFLLKSHSRIILWFMVNSSLHSIALQALPKAASNTSQSSLDCKLYHSPIPQATRRAIFTRFWVLNQRVGGSCFLKGDHTAYFRYYEAQCSSLIRGKVSLRNQNQEYLLKIIEYLQNSDLEYRSIVDSLLRDYPQLDHSLVRPSIFTAARLWSMLHIGEEEQAVTPGQKPIEWEDGTLKKCIQQCFEIDSDVLDSVKLPKSFNAMALAEIGNIQIVWTNNLADHLLMRNDDTKVTIFHHADFLRRHGEGKLYAP